ncbi:MAG: SET domain-containing protein [Nitrosarchaeum sp.]
MLNRKIEKRNISKIDRFGLFAKEMIFKDELIWTPTDDTTKSILPSELEKLPLSERQVWIDHCYQIDDCYYMEIDDTRLMNHSCDPNTVDFPADDPTQIIAARNIEKNEEITWNYLPFMNPFQVFQCKCGSKNCVGIVKKNATLKSH